jgi:hypothetical protein
MNTASAANGNGRLGARLSGAARGLAVGLSLAALVGCGGVDDAAWDEAEDESIGEAELAGWPIGANNITTAVLLRSSLAGISTGKLCINTNNPNQCEVTGAWDGWQNTQYPVERGQMLKAMVRCAMPAGYTVYVPGNGGGTFTGTWGFLPGWRSNSLTTAQQEILTGCVLALINANNVEVDIAIIAPYDTSLPAQSMPYMEAVFYGNMFWPGPARIACGGLQEDGGDRVPGRDARICGEAGNPCHIDAIGACNGPYVPQQSGYCVQWAGGGDGKYCAVARDDGSKLWSYPATVYLDTQPYPVPGPLYRCGDGNDYCPPEV